MGFLVFLVNVIGKRIFKDLVCRSYPFPEYEMFDLYYMYICMYICKCIYSGNKYVNMFKLMLKLL
jgi:hypothetical protein